jgi:DNA-binding XRE family transcriptional regulator
MILLVEIILLGVILTFCPQDVKPHDLLLTVIGSPSCCGESMPVLLGAKLRYLRQQRQMTQEELARQLGLRRQGHVSNLEMGRKTPSLDLLVQIADLFGVTTDYLLHDAAPVEMVEPRTPRDLSEDSQTPS